MAISLLVIHIRVADSQKGLPKTKTKMFNPEKYYDKESDACEFCGQQRGYHECSECGQEISVAECVRYFGVCDECSELIDNK